MLNKIISLLVLMVISIAAPAYASHTIDESGLKGRIKGIVCEKTSRGIDCDDDYISMSVIVTTLSGNAIAKITSDERGRFEVLLPAGTYRLVGVEPGQDIFPSIVTVEEGDIDRIKLNQNGTIKINF